MSRRGIPSSAPDFDPESLRGKSSYILSVPSGANGIVAVFGLLAVLVGIVAFFAHH